MKKTKFIIIIVLLLLVVTLLISYFIESYVPPILRAHKADITTPLESEGLFPKPDFVLYDKGDATIELSSEQQELIWAKFQQLISERIGARFDDSNAALDLKEQISDMKENGAIRFCYSQRRKFTGAFLAFEDPFPDDVEDEEEQKDKVIAITYVWKDLQYDEVIFQGNRFFIGLDGKYQWIPTCYAKYYFKSELSINYWKTPGGEGTNMQFLKEGDEIISFNSMVDIAEAGIAG